MTLTAPLFDDAATADLWGAPAQIADMLRVWAALARAQGRLGVIPADAAECIAQALAVARVDPDVLAAATARNGVPIPGLIAALRQQAAPGQLDALHWGATSQDIMDTALALRIGAMLDLWDGRLAALIGRLGTMAAAHADLPMAARTYGQAAVPTTFGAVVASWGRPLLRHRARMDAVRTGAAQVSLSGAAGTNAAMGAAGPAVRAAVAQDLGLMDPGASWHAERDGIVAFGQWMAGLTASLGKMGADLILLAQSGLSEVHLAGSGGSSTMPQKQNPVGPSVLAALAGHAAGLSATLTGSAVHRQQRDGAAWFTEWLVLPALCTATGRALALAAEVAAQVAPDPAAMARGLSADAGTIHAESLTFALSTRMSRPQAEARVKALCAQALSSGVDVRSLAQREWPDLPAGPDTGQAAAEARAFAAAVQNGKPV